MSGLGKKRISAKEAAEFLGIPYANISRIDRRGEIIKRYKLGHKTYVYDLESLEAFLEAKLVRPITAPRIVSPRSVTTSRKLPALSFEKPESSLREFLLEMRSEPRTKARGKK